MRRGILRLEQDLVLKGGTLGVNVALIAINFSQPGIDLGRGALLKGSFIRRAGSGPVPNLAVSACEGDRARPGKPGGPFQPFDGLPGLLRLQGLNEAAFVIGEITARKEAEPPVAYV